MELPSVDPPPAAKKTLDSIPRDHQFDLEIYLKEREIATIKKEISRAESILSDIKQAITNETTAASMPEAAHYTRRSAMYYHGGSQALYQQNRMPMSSPTKRKVYRTSEKSKLFGRRQDGVFVSLACPVCHRDDFANQQGFLNHCRISHNLEFGPYEQIMIQCGTPVDDSEVPMDHPARLRPVMNLAPVTKQQNKKLERPSIKVFEEDVDMDLENEHKIQQTHLIVESESALQPEPIATTSIEKSDSAIPSELPQESNETLANTDLTTNTTVKDDAKEQTAEREEEEGEVTHQPDEKEEGQQREEDIPKVESLAAAVSSADTAEVGSRFYIKRRIIVGNVSKFIIPERRDPALKQFTHKWMIYVVEPPQSKESISAFITCARFYLHPSYKPHDVVDVTEPPFKLTRLGWGEFPVRVQLFFVDRRRNKAVDLIHHLKLDNSHSGRQLLGGERSIEIELDRNTDFKDTNTIPLAIQDTLQEHASIQENQQVQPQEIEPNHSMAAKQKMSLLNGMLKESIRKLPIIRAGSHGTVLPYTCAPSPKTFFKWSLGKRKALEWQRARLLRLQVQSKAFEVNDNVLRTAAESLSTKDVLLWCREHKYTPLKLEDIEDKKEESTFIMGYCKFCGNVRDEHDETADDNCPQKPKGWNTRKRNAGGISSLSSVTRLLSQLEVGWDEVKEIDEEMDVDVDVDERANSSLAPSSKEKDISARVEDWSLESDAMDVANERSLDWIWSVIGQLRLKSVIANDMLLAKDGNLQGPTSTFDLDEAMKQRLVVGNIVTQATRLFLKKLLNRTVNICRKEEEGSANKSVKMMVPYHVYQAAQQADEFDFLTNQYMGSEEDKIS
ncbi:yeats family-domain-containing protein [Blakeslea trispora]|nr:yeats family-domain-containing protein [Blakeslea trispora]